MELQTVYENTRTKTGEGSTDATNLGLARTYSLPSDFSTPSSATVMQFDTPLKLIMASAASVMMYAAATAEYPTSIKRLEFDSHSKPCSALNYVRTYSSYENCGC